MQVNPRQYFTVGGVFEVLSANYEGEEHSSTIMIIRTWGRVTSSNGTPKQTSEWPYETSKEFWISQSEAYASLRTNQTCLEKNQIIGGDFGDIYADDREQRRLMENQHSKR